MVGAYRSLHVALIRFLDLPQRAHLLVSPHEGSPILSLPITNYLRTEFLGSLGELRRPHAAAT